MGQPLVATTLTSGDALVPADHSCCRATLTLAAKDDSIAVVVSVLLRKRWSIRELTLRHLATATEVSLVATKAGGDVAVLVAALRREVLVIDVQLVASSEVAESGVAESGVAGPPVVDDHHRLAVSE